MQALLSGCYFLLSLFLRVLAALAESNMHVGSHSSALFDARSVEGGNGSRNVEESIDDNYHVGGGRS